MYVCLNVVDNLENREKNSLFFYSEQSTIFMIILFNKKYLLVVQITVNGLQIHRNSHSVKLILLFAFLEQCYRVLISDLVKTTFIFIGAD